MTDIMEQSTSPSADSALALVAQLRAGDAGAGDLLHCEYGEALRRFCWAYLGTVEAAEDAVQEIHCKVLEAAEVPDVFRPWLYRVARNHCLNILRAKKRQKDRYVLPPASELQARLTGHLTRMVKQELQSNLMEALAALDPAQREVLQLRYAEGLSRGEIAAVLEVSESTVKSRLFRGMQQLRKLTDHAQGSD